jgi:hypothetical protein
VALVHQVAEHAGLLFSDKLGARASRGKVLHKLGFLVDMQSALIAQKLVALNLFSNILNDKLIELL